MICPASPTWPQYLQPGPSVFLQEDEEGNGCLTSTCLVLLFAFIASSQGEEVKRSHFCGCLKIRVMVLPMGRWGKPSCLEPPWHPFKPSTAGAADFGQVSLLRSTTATRCSVNEFSVCCERKERQLRCREGAVGVSWCEKLDRRMCAEHCGLMLSTHEKEHGLVWLSCKI